MEAIVEIEQAPGLQLDENLSFDEWKSIGIELAKNIEGSKWQLGDWAAFGDHKYGKLKEFAEANNINYQTLKNVARVSNRIEKSRRRYLLEWSYYEAVASQKPKKQTEWLERAIAEKLNVGGLRRLIRISKGECSALVSEGQTIKMLTKYYDDLVAELKKKPADFWTPEIKRIWKERLKWFSDFAEAL